MDNLLNMDQAAEVLNVTARTLQREVADGRLKTVAIRGSTRISRAEIAFYIAAASLAGEARDAYRYAAQHLAEFPAPFKGAILNAVHQQLENTEPTALKLNRENIEQFITAKMNEYCAVFDADDERTIDSAAETLKNYARDYTKKPEAE